MQRCRWIASSSLSAASTWQPLTVGSDWQLLLGCWVAEQPSRTPNALVLLGVATVADRIASASLALDPQCWPVRANLDIRSSAAMQASAD